MKILKNLSLACILASTILFFPVLSQAQVASTAVGTVNYAGQVGISGNTYAVIVFTPTGGSASTFVLPSATSNSMLAIALTAISSGKLVTCQFDVGGNLIVLYANNS